MRTPPTEPPAELGVQRAPGAEKRWQANLHCPACANTVPIHELQSGEEEETCPACEKPLVVRLYPALMREKAAANAGRRVLLDDESACFFHSSKWAESVCEDCGRYLCGLCEIVFEGKTLCPSCLGSAQA